MMPSSYGGPRIRLHIAGDIPAEDDRTPLQHALPGRPSHLAVLKTAPALERHAGTVSQEDQAGTVARRSGCPSRGRRPVAGTDHSARDAQLEASNPGLERDTHSS